jgi:3-oxoacyl-[acyl-carrier protein] reductase
MLIIIGSTGGLGRRLLKLCEQQAHESSWLFGRVLGATRADVDLTNEESIARFAAHVAETVPAGEPIKIINAAGISINALAHKMTLDDFQKSLQVNLIGNFLVIKHFQSLFKARPKSSVVILSSVVSETGVPGTIAYASSKSGLRGLCRVSSRELARFSTTVNLIELGYFEAGMIEQVPPDFQDSIKKEIPLGRFGTAEELMEACRFLLGCGYVTGAAIKVNGGLI